MLGRVDQFQPVGDPQRLGQVERPVKRCERVRVELVTHQRDPLGLVIMLVIDQSLDLMGPIDRGPPIADPSSRQPPNGSLNIHTWQMPSRT